MKKGYEKYRGFDKMAGDNELEQWDKEKNCILPLYIVDTSDCVCQILKKRSQR